MNFDDFLSRASCAVIEATRPDGVAQFANREHGDLYGTAAAVGILIALGRQPVGAEANRYSAALQAFRRPDDTFAADSHNETHRAATALTTLSVLGRSPSLPAQLEPLMQAEAVAPFLNGLDWANPWLASHDAAGMLAIGLVTSARRADEREQWLAAYLDRLDSLADPATGLWRTGLMGDVHDDPGLFGNLGCSFHMHFLYERLGRVWPNPTGVVDAGLTLYADAVAAREPADWGFRQLDWAYSVGRASERSAHRRAEVDAALLDLAERTSDVLAAPGAAEGDLHVLQARVGLVAELARALPDMVDVGTRTMTPIVDVRPFI